jgi:YidC/Oxa1 family membrane protein insertase
MEGKQQKLYYFFLFAIALVSVFLLSTVMKPKEKQQPGGDKTPAAKKAGKSAPAAESAGKTEEARPAADKTADKPGEARPAAEKAAGKPGESKEAAKAEEKTDAPTRAERRRKARERLTKQKTAAIETDRYRAEVSDLNTGLLSFRIKGDRYRNEQNEPIDIVTTDKEPYFPLAMELLDAGTGETVLGDDPYWKVERLSRRALRLSLGADGIGVVRKLEAGEGPYQLWVTTTVANRTQEPRRLAYGIAVHHYVEREKEESSAFFLSMPSPELSKGLCYYRTPAKKGTEQSSELVLERNKRDDLLKPRTFKGKLRFAGVENTYFLNAAAPHPVKGQPAPGSCELASVNYVRMPNGAVRRLQHESESGTELGSLFTTRLVYPDIELGAGAAQTFRVLAYLGPKMPEDLAAAGHGLSKSIDFGFFAVLSEGLTWLLRVIHAGVGNWGLAIILLTFLVKAVLYPLTAKSLHSMARMRMLKPEMDRINELYKDDREKKSAALMELYRKHGINPLGGCLPQLLQLPIWLALYTSLRTNVELYHAPFILWWTDLSSPDPYFVLPLLLAALMFLQMRMSPPAADPVQAKMMLYMMPTMMGAFMLFLPAGLCVYILTNSALSIGQQRLIERNLQKLQASAASGQGEKPAGPTDDPGGSSAGKEPRKKQPRPGKPQGRSRSGRRKKTA